MNLRPYQVDAVRRVFDAFNSGTKRLMLYAPTGAGKTVVATEIIKRARVNLCPGKSICFISNRIELGLQTSRVFASEDLYHGILQSTNTCNSDSDLLICSIQTLARRGVPTNVGFVIIDEAHGTAASEAYHKLIHSLECPVLGLSATPFAAGLGKHHKELAGPLWEELLVTTTIQDLIDQQFLVDCEIYAPSAPDLSKVKIVRGDYDEKQLGVAVDQVTLVGDIVEQWKRRAGGRPTVCFATNIAHSHHICERFKAAGVVAEHIDSYMDQSAVKEIMARVRAGKVTVISNVGILCEGVDVPLWEVQILARPTRSLSRYVQMSGRVLRPYPGKNLALILDHSGSCETLGFPTDPLPLVLDNGKPKIAASRDPREKKAKKCPKCKFMKRPGESQCPRCGYTPQRVSNICAAAGDLHRQERKRVKGLIASADSQKLYDELLGYTIEKGYKRGWAWIAMNELRGECPKWGAPKPPSTETMHIIQHYNIRRAHQRKRARA